MIFSVCFYTGCPYWCYFLCTYSFKWEIFFRFKTMSGCFVKIDKVTFVAKTALVYEFYFNFNKCQNRETLIHQEQKFVTHFDLWVPVLCKQPSAITYIFPAIKSRASFTQHKKRKIRRRGICLIFVKHMYHLHPFQLQQ